MALHGAGASGFDTVMFLFKRLCDGQQTVCCSWPGLVKAWSNHVEIEGEWSLLLDLVGWLLRRYMMCSFLAISNWGCLDYLGMLNNTC